MEYAGRIYAIKELPDRRAAEKEYENLRALIDKRLPTVEPVGHALIRHVSSTEPVSVLITLFLEYSLPYRSLFIQRGMERYWERLWDALACLLVRLHLAGFYWGDCSLSNVLFKRDAGELCAHVVDVETSEIHEKLSDGQREMDLSIMEENIYGALKDMTAEFGMTLPRPAEDIVGIIRDRYLALWKEINREVVISKSDHYKIHERIEALNKMGFSIDEVQLVESGESGKLKMRTLVTDQSYHRHHLHNLTGIVANDNESRQMLNEIRTLRAAMCAEKNRSIPLSAAAFRWLNEVFYPCIKKLKARTEESRTMADLYCQVLEHKWYLSEKAGRDVGMDKAIADYNAKIRS